MGLKTYLTELLNLDRRDKEMEDKIKTASEKAAVNALVDFTRYGLNLLVNPSFRMPMEYWPVDYATAAKRWFEKEIKDQIIGNHKILISGLVSAQADAYFRSDEFLDRIIDRINRKQIRPGIPLSAPLDEPKARPGEASEPEQENP